MAFECSRIEANREGCACTSTDCERRGRCCACVANHRSHGNFPACLRPPAE